MSEPLKTFRFTATAVIDLGASEGNGARKPRFSILAYTGDAMRVGAYSTPVVIELAGLKATRKHIPILFDHDPKRVVGQTDAITFADAVTLEGHFTSDKDDAGRILEHAQNGFEWAASIGASVSRSDFLKVGAKAVVNGREVVGPMTIVRAAKLHETSFVSIGADENATASIAASQGDIMTPETQHDETTTEKARIQAIIKECGSEYTAIREQAIEAGWSIAETKAEILTALRSSRAKVYPAGHARPALRRDAIEAALMLRAGLETLAVSAYGDQVVSAAHALRNPSLVDVAGYCLQLDGIDTSGMSRSQIVATGFSTTSLPSALANVTGKTLLPAYQEGINTWAPLASIRSAADFKPQSAIRPSIIGELEQVGAAGEIKHAQLGEDALAWSIDTYARQLRITRQHVINDDLAMFSQTAPLLGQMAARSISSLVWKTWLGSAATHWRSGRGNLLTTGSALDSGSLSEAIALMRSQKDADGNSLAIAPSFLVVPPELDMTAKALVSSALVGTTGGAPTGNPLQNICEVIVEPRLSNSKYTGYSATGWYLVAGPSAVPIVVGYLDNKSSPTVETFGLDSDIDTLGYSFRCYFDYGCAMGDYRASVRATGAA